MPRTSHPAATVAPRPWPTAEHAARIERSHERSAAHGLSRIERPDYAPLGSADLAMVRDRNRRLFSQAAPLMDMLFDQISGTESMVVLCDAAGVILHSVGDADFLARASQVALQPGVNWSEAAKGTNAIGTALVEAVPTLVHADEHFMVANQFLTCSAAPILDPRGRVLGVLDVTGDHRSYHRHTMALVRMTARMIENQWLSEQHQRALRVHFHRRAECLGTLVEGLLAVGPDGRVLGCNRSALELLGIDGAVLRQRGLSALLGCSVGQLLDRFRSPLATPLPVTTDAGGFYVRARFGTPVWGEVSDAVADTGHRVGGVAGADGAPTVDRADAMATRLPAPMADVRHPDGRSGPPSATGLATGPETVPETAPHMASERAPSRARWLCGGDAADRAARAHALHLAGDAADAPLLTLRASALQTQTLHDAIRVVGTGSLFIDDIDALPAPLQGTLADALARASGPRLLAGRVGDGDSAGAALTPALRRHFGATPPGGPAAKAPQGAKAKASHGATQGATLGALQRRAIVDAIAAADGNISVAARRLGVSRNTVYRKLRANRG